MKIGIDIDDTITNTEESFYNVIKKYNIKFNKGYRETWTDDEFKFIGYYLEEILENATLKKDVKEVIDKLNERHELYVITARRGKYPGKVKDITLKMFNDNKLNFKEVYFAQDIKSDLAKSLNIDLMIDDNIKIYNNMKKENIDCILFGDKIKTWKEVLEYIERKET